MEVGERLCGLARHHVLQRHLAVLLYAALGEVRLRVHLPSHRLVGRQRTQLNAAREPVHRAKHERLPVHGTVLRQLVHDELSEHRHDN